MCLFIANPTHWQNSLSRIAHAQELINGGRDRDNNGALDGAFPRSRGEGLGPPAFARHPPIDRKNSLGYDY